MMLWPTQRLLIAPLVGFLLMLPSIISHPSSLLPHPSSPSCEAAGWAQEALAKEAGYIVNCSFTELARNHGAVRATADGYGAINVDRIYQLGPDWVRPGEASMGVIGLMAAAIQLKSAGVDTGPYDGVLGRFFQTWLLARKQPMDTDPASADDGGCYERVYYDASGRWKKHDAPNAGVTGQLVSAMWKFYEYNRAIGQTQAAADWLRQAWPMARQAGNFLKKNYNPTYQLVRTNAGGANLWSSDSAYAAMALRCLDEWAKAAGKTPAYDYAGLAANIAAGLQRLEDKGARKSFFRYRDSRHQMKPTYGDRIDQICFLPYEANVLDPGDPFARSISDWWTHGSDGLDLTYVAADSSDWRHFGTRYGYSLKPAAENNNLYPGPGLQLAKVEWKHWQKTGDAVTLDRARKRFEWARSPAYSNLWLGCSHTQEANVPDGLVDWRDATNYAHKADNWARFVDTSAYFIEVTLMLEYGVDTKYVPN